MRRRVFILPVYFTLISILLFLAFHLPAGQAAPKSLSNGSIRFRVRIHPLSIKGPQHKFVKRDKVFKVGMTVANRGPYPIKRVKAELSVSKGLTVLEKTSRRRLGFFSPGQAKVRYWSIRARAIGKKRINVAVTGHEGVTGQKLTAAKTSLILVSASSPPRGIFFRLLRYLGII